MKRQVLGSTDKGMVRETNQDRFEVGIIDDMSFAVLCDGMGGENGGNIASDMGVSFAATALKRDLSKKMTELSIRAVFSTIFSGANAKIYEAACKDSSLKGMGTTMILAVQKDQSLYVASVGDSRVYVANKEKEEQITTDHTVVQMMVDCGDLSQEEASCHPKRHYITRAVGVDDLVEMDFFVYDLSEDDIALLCSDGFHTYLEEGILYEQLRISLESNSLENLIELAKKAGGADNITTVIMA